MRKADVGKRWAGQYTRQRTISVELTVDMRGAVFHSKIADPSLEHLHERALVAIMSCRRMTLKYARRDGASTVHTGLLPATITNSPGSR